MNYWQKFKSMWVKIKGFFQYLQWLEEQRIKAMIKLYSQTLDELKLEIESKKLEISREAVISTLIGLERGVDEVTMQVEMVYDSITLQMVVKIDEYQECFEKNKEALIELEEYELLAEIQKHIG